MATKLAHPDKTPQTAWPDVAIPPGETLAEELTARGLSQTELAQQMGRPLQTVNMIVKGKKAITEETALQLERVLGVSATFWMNLQTNYNLTKARLAQQPALAVARHVPLGALGFVTTKKMGSRLLFAKKKTSKRGPKNK